MKLTSMLCASLALAALALTANGAFAAQCPKGEVLNPKTSKCASALVMPRPEEAAKVKSHSNQNNNRVKNPAPPHGIDNGSLSTYKVSPANPVPCPKGEVLNPQTRKCGI